MNKNAKYNLEIFEKLPIRAKELIFEEGIINDDIFSSIECYDCFLKSPIEKILLVSLSIYLYKTDNNLFYMVQKEIKINNKKYISDFYIEYDEYVNPLLKEDFKLVIECDGFEYHHNNKKQVEYDYNRENDLKLNGYDVIRFTGSKIYNEPMKCAKEIIDYVILKNKKVNK